MTTLVPTLALLLLAEPATPDSMLPATPPRGYRLLAEDGGVFAFGSSFEGGMTACGGPGGAAYRRCHVRVLAATPSGAGYWAVSGDAVVEARGDAPELHLEEQFFAASAAASTPTGRGLLVLHRDTGRVYTAGDAPNHGTADGRQFRFPLGATGLAATPSGHGFWIAGGDGAVFALGDAVFAGSMSGRPLNEPIVGLARTPSGNGYWLVASDGGVFAFGDAPFAGSLADRPHRGQVVGLAPTVDGAGYWLAASDGGVFSFGTAPFLGSAVGLSLTRSISAIAAAP